MKFVLTTTTFINFQLVSLQKYTKKLIVRDKLVSFIISLHIS